MRPIELLAPAKTADIGIAAIRHGADAVYIGAPAFGARAAAGNSVEDIGRLVEFAHLYKARVYVTVNTVIFEHEMPEVERLIWQLYEAKVDALIIQDLRLLSLNLPPIPLHASTQMDNRTADQVRRLADLGFPQVVLARELPLETIADIHQQCPGTRLEVFVHGALCVSLSGRCNASEALFGRSANRGECAQVCRMKFDLIQTPSPTLPRNGEGGRPDSCLMRKTPHGLPPHYGGGLGRGSFFLSLRDNCQLPHLESLLMAGASSLKIEGRLKDADYVKNVTAAYSEALNRVIAKHPNDFCRASSGHVNLKFEPNVWKSFNRGFVKDVNKPDANFDTPKAMGEPVTRHTILHNGDGLCYIDKGQLIGFRVNNAETFRPQRGVQYYRNQDTEWDKMLSKPSAERKISVNIEVHDDHITMTDEDGITATLPFDNTFELAHTHQQENIRRQLSKLGDTIFEAHIIYIYTRKNYFIPSSTLSTWRRTLTDRLTAERLQFYPQEHQEHTPIRIETETPHELTHDPATPVMTCHHCIRRQLGKCLKDGHKAENWALRMANGTTFRLDFDCKNCLMKLYLT